MGRRGGVNMIEQRVRGNGSIVKQNGSVLSHVQVHKAAINMFFPHGSHTLPL